MFKVQLRQHLVFISREVVLARTIEIPIAPFPGLTIELSSSEEKRWEVRIKDVLLKSNGTLIAILAWWPDDFAKDGTRTEVYKPGIEAEWDGFHVIWDNGRDFVGEDY